MTYRLRRSRRSTRRRSRKPRKSRKRSRKRSRKPRKRSRKRSRKSRRRSRRRSKGVCPICMDDLDKKEVITTKCKHKFHKKCLETWLERSRFCPLCRRDIGDDKPKKMDWEETYNSRGSRGSRDGYAPMDIDYDF